MPVRRLPTWRIMIRAAHRGTDMIEKCPLHNKMEYSKEYDSEYCPDCNEWLIGKCTDPTCEFCSKRPARPMAEVK